MKSLTLKDLKYLLDHLFQNKSSLDKISESTEGEMLYNGQAVNSKDAETVGGHTVESDVPANAVFTDTIYDDTNIQKEVDDLQLASHSHDNKEILDKISESATGEMLFNGEEITGGIKVWTSGTNYELNEFVENAGKIYKCTTSPQVNPASFNAAEWLMISGGGGGTVDLSEVQAQIDSLNTRSVIGSELSYGYFAAQDQVPTIGSLVKFNSKLIKDFPLNGVDKISGFKKGRSYKITGSFYVYGAAGYIACAVYEGVSNTKISDNVVATTPTGTNNYGNNIINFIFTPTVDCDIYIKVLEITGTMSIGGVSNLTIEEINRTVVADPMDVKGSYILEYADLYMSATQTLTIGTTRQKIKFNASNSNNMSINLTNNSVHLTKGKTYRIYASLALNTSSRITYNVVNSSTLVSAFGADAMAISSNYNEAYVNIPIDVIYTATADIDISVATVNVNVASTNLLESFCRFNVQEIAQPVVVEYNNLNYLDPMDVKDQHVIEYGSFELSANQTTDLLVNNLIKFNNKIGGNIDINTSTFGIKLKANKTYKISGFIYGMLETATSYCGIRLKDLTAGIYIGKEACVLPATYTFHNTPSNVLDAIYTPSVDCEIAVCISYVSGKIINIISANSVINVQEIAQPVVVEYNYPHVIDPAEIREKHEVEFIHLTGRNSENIITLGTAAGSYDKINILPYFNDIVKSSNIDRNSDGTITLKAGKKYSIFFSLWSNATATSGKEVYGFIRDTNGVEYGSQGFFRSGLSPSYGSDTPATAIIDVPKDADIKIMGCIMYQYTLQTVYCSFMVQEIAQPLVIEYNYPHAIDPFDAREAHTIDYCQLFMNTDQTFAANTDGTVLTKINFDGFVAGNMEYDLNNKMIKLKAGRTYEIEAHLLVNTTTSVDYFIADASNNSRIGFAFGRAVASTYTTASSDTPCKVIYTPSTDINVCVIAYWPMSSTTIYHYFAKFIVKEIAQPQVVEYNYPKVIDPFDVENKYAVEYLNMTCNSATISIVANMYYPLNTVLGVRGIENNTTSYYFILKAGKTYNICALLAPNGTGRFLYQLRDVDTGAGIGAGAWAISVDNAITLGATSINFTYTPTKDTKIGLWIISVIGTIKTVDYNAALTVNEIAQPKVIEYNYPNVLDPFEVNEDHSIEYGSFRPGAYYQETKTTQAIVKFDTVVASNMEFDPAKFAVKLKAGKVYHIEVDLQTFTTALQVMALVDTYTGAAINDSYAYLVTADKAEGKNSIPIQTIYKPTIDQWISVALTTVNNYSPAGVYIDHFSRFNIHEIKQPQVIEYVNEISNPLTTTDISQETPVGSIINYIGKTAPANYLACDGATYNIADYPELANFIKSEYGSYNYWGGNGTTTFAVPVKIKGLKNLIPVMTSNTEPYGAAIANGTYNGYQPYWAFTELIQEGWASTSLPAIIEYDFPVGTIVTMYSIRSRTGDVFDVSRSPKNWTFEAWNGSAWIVLDTRTNVIWYSSNDEKLFCIETTKAAAYTKYRLNVTASNGNAIIIIKLKMFNGATGDMYCIKYKPTYYAVNQYGGFESKVLFDGKANAVGDYNLIDSVENYDFILVKGGIASTNQQVISNLILSNDINYSLTNQYSYNASITVSPTVYARRVLYHFSNKNTLKIDEIKKDDGLDTIQIYKIIGIKGQIPTLLSGGIL